MTSPLSTPNEKMQQIKLSLYITAEKHASSTEVAAILCLAAQQTIGNGSRSHITYELLPRFRRLVSKQFRLHVTPLTLFWVQNGWNAFVHVFHDSSLFTMLCIIALLEHLQSKHT